MANSYWEIRYSTSKHLVLQVKTKENLRKVVYITSVYSIKTSVGLCQTCGGLLLANVHRGEVPLDAPCPGVYRLNSAAKVSMAAPATISPSPIGAVPTPD
jgi:hypothetical protein